MRDQANRRPTWPIGLALGLMLGVLAAPARAGKLSWLDDVVRDVIRETETGARTAVGSADARAAHAGGRLFVREADESREALAKRSDALARAARRIDAPAEALLEARFARLVRPESG